MNTFINIFNEVVSKCADCGMQSETMCPNCTGPGSLWDLVYQCAWADSCGDGKWAISEANRMANSVVIFATDISEDDCVRCHTPHSRGITVGSKGQSQYDTNTLVFSLCDVCVEELFK